MTDVTVTEAPEAGTSMPERREPCPDCAQRGTFERPVQFVYVIGKLDVRMPSLGIEREFRRYSRADPEASTSRGQRLRSTLEANHHLASRVCYVLSVASTPAYSLVPSTQAARHALLASLDHIDLPDQWTVAIGVLGPVCRASDCGGLLVPIVACDQIFSFNMEEWIADLRTALDRSLTAKAAREALPVAARELFMETVSSVQNIGLNEAHRALNFLLMRHPGVFLAVTERRGRAVLDRLETRLHYGLGTRRHVTVVFSFVDQATGVPERLFCRVDVTEEWPFAADQPDGSPAPLGLMPFLESDLLGVGP